MPNWSEDDLRSLGFDEHGLRRYTNATQATTLPPVKAEPEEKKGRYGNIRTMGPAPWGGQRKYDSKLEAEKARELRDRESIGQNHGWFCQVSFPIGIDDNGREIRARVDFLEITPEKTLVAWDPKGFENGKSRIKRAALRARGIDVRVW